MHSPSSSLTLVTILRSTLHLTLLIISFQFYYHFHRILNFYPQQLVDCSTKMKRLPLLNFFQMSVHNTSSWSQSQHYIQLVTSGTFVINHTLSVAFIYLETLHTNGPQTLVITWFHHFVLHPLIFHACVTIFNHTLDLLVYALTIAFVFGMHQGNSFRCVYICGMLNLWNFSYNYIKLLKTCEFHSHLSLQLGRSLIFKFYR